jgi:hypothetical protein
MKRNMPSEPRSLRLTFRYENGEVRLIGKQTVNKVGPPSDALAGPMPQSGHWLELRDERGKAIYRLLMAPPIPHEVEVLTDAGTLTRVPVLEPAGVFTLLVPDLSEASTLALVGSRPAAGPVTAAARRSTAASDYASFDLRQEDFA